ncbi:serine/threonine protein phosphatase [Helicobacter sp. MIT 11-5569]|uniref:metallophosphoesterase family protein n=1 Tax=Helicobacter sp. MIT 11-5569 TaxID=1548151 RepID=UPI00051FB3F5|nr:metallophosphoesterase family protein [Helicobacter sp. MIT 11-5569]TLD81148.1 serine/threonine protein phosphatase [Helicobacter sp. MIT 11-5569]
MQVDFDLDFKRPLYIIGDVHGCYKTLCALIENLPQKEKSQMIFVGDLVDRGTESCEVVEFVIFGKYPCVLGNHEILMMEFYNSASVEREGVWIENGGRETIQSYAKDGKIKHLKKHLEYFENLPLYLEMEYPDESGKNLFISHGFGLPLYGKKISEEYCWNRLKHYGKSYKRNDVDIFNVFGHDVQKEGVLITENFAAIDTGCVYYSRLPNATLSALEWPSKRVISQKYCG